MAGVVSGICPECGRPVFRFTDRAREVIVRANQCALLLLSEGHPLQQRPKWWHAPRRVAEIEPSHILLGLVDGPCGVGYHALKNSGVDPPRLREDILCRLSRCHPQTFHGGTKLPLSRKSRRIVDVAIEEARKLNHDWVGTEHILLAICRSGDRATKCRLRSWRVSGDRVRAFVIQNMAMLRGSSDT
jgi:ATP-dependent Clp protease ATP-binding subunit ClpC